MQSQQRLQAGSWTVGANEYNIRIAQVTRLERLDECSVRLLEITSFLTD